MVIPIFSKPFNSRDLYLFNSASKESFISAIEQPLRDEIAELLIQINTGLNDIDALEMLPLDYQVDHRVRISLAKNKCDWGTMTGLWDTSLNEYNVDYAMANYHLGNKTDGVDLWRDLENWDEVTNRVSYPKR